MPEAVLNFPLAIADSFVSVLVVILGIGLLIFVHELGHFAVAKWCKVRVEAFSLGFGPVLLGFRRGDTHYRLSAIPLGGYVKMAGETPSDDHSEDPAEFQNKSILQRTAILSAGVVMNAIVGILLFVIAFNVGVPLAAPVVGGVQPGSPAWQAGIKAGDRVLSIDGTKSLDFDDVIADVAFSRGPVDVVVERDGEEITFSGIVPNTTNPRGMPLLGMDNSFDSVIRVVEGSPAEEAGLRTGDELVTAAGAPGDRAREAIAAMVASEGPVTFVVRREGETLTFTGTPKKSPADPALVGITPFLYRIAAVRSGSEAARAGFKAGDVVDTVDGKTAAGLREAEKLAGEAGAEAVTFAVRRGSETVRLAPVASDDWEGFFDGVAAGLGDLNSTRVALVDDKTFEGGNPARAAGLVDGATILEVNGRKMTKFEEIQAAISSTGTDDPVRILFEVGGAEQPPIEVVRRKQMKLEDFGIVWAVSTETVRVEGIPAAVGAGLRRSLRKGRQILQMLGGLFTGRVSMKNIGGPIMIFQVAYDAAKRDFAHFLYFLGIISINLAILNILPIPVLDGGHLFFILIEAIRRKPLPEKAMALFQWAGLIFLVLLMVFVIANDVTR